MLIDNVKKLDNLKDTGRHKVNQTNLYLRIKRLLSPRYMGDLFKVVLAYKFRKDNFAGF